MKKLLVGAFLGIFTLAWIAVLPNYVSAEDSDPWANPKADTQMLWNQKLTWSKLITTIKNAVNWLLGILATIALVICLYGWFLMVTSAGDEKKYGEWLKVLKYAAIGLAIIWLSWMIVSVVFRFIGTLWKGNQTKAGNTNLTSNQGNLQGSSDDTSDDVDDVDNEEN